ncbi:MAG TPA: NTP transferase domain-containing protein [Pirellulaceae bacterium]|nr:NTP transferase domain-containing protein [Planctomycetales bacterium]MCB9939654.1 NTP transferase domain-containing protein [Planctomycetaceae bacterium]HRX82922.1 NTP transferase domain-containing protein [Pirellulaceae bacterium]
MTKQAIVLAGGKGTRMKSDLPKVLFEACGRPMISYVVDVLERAGIERIIVVVGYRADLVRQTLADRPNVIFAEQTEQLGTGHAVMMCRDALQGQTGPVLIVTGDSPLIQQSSVEKLLTDFSASQPACLLGTLHKEDPTGLGRIVRDANGDFEGIVEEKDATDAQRAITEVNMSTYVFDTVELLNALDQLTDDNRQREYYLTDCPGILKRQGKEVRALAVLEPCESLSVNTLDDLRIVEDEMRKLQS